MDLPFLHAPHIGVPGIIEVIVSPEDKALSLHHAEHFGGHVLFHPGVQN
jgi:hypothetical protein